MGHLFGFEKDLFKHSLAERARIGLWVFAGCSFTLDTGYTVEHVYKIWHFSKPSSKLLEKYIKNLSHSKIKKASSYPSEVPDDARCHEYIRKYKHNTIESNPTKTQMIGGKGQVVVLLLNSLWGGVA